VSLEPLASDCPIRSQSPRTASAPSRNGRRRRRRGRGRSAPAKSNSRAIPAPSALKKSITRLLILGFCLLRSKPPEVALRVLALLGHSELVRERAYDGAVLTPNNGVDHVARRIIPVGKLRGGGLEELRHLRDGVFN